MKTKEIRLLAFGQMAEIVTSASVAIDIDGNTNDLKKALTTNFPDIANIPYAIAVNNTLVTTPIILTEHDEVALLPPFSGG